MCQPFSAGIGASDGGREWLFDFVSQRRSHFSQHAQAIDVCQIGFQLTQPFTPLLSVFALSDVAGATDQSD